MQILGVLLVIVAIVMLIVGLINCIKDIKKKRKKLSKQAAIPILAGFTLFIVGMEVTPETEYEKADKKEKEDVAAEVEEEEDEKVNLDNEEGIKDFVGEIIDSKRIDNVEYNKDDKELKLSLTASDNLTSNMIRGNMLMDSESILEKLTSEGFIGTIDIEWKFNVVDKYGEEYKSRVMEVVMEEPTIDKINFDNFSRDNIPNVADDYYEHPALSD